MANENSDVVSPQEPQQNNEQAAPSAPRPVAPAPVVEQAEDRGTGARGLRSIMEEVLKPVMFDLPSRDDIATVVITGDVVREGAEPTLISQEVQRKRRNKSA